MTMWNIFQFEKEPLRSELLKIGELIENQLNFEESVRNFEDYIIKNVEGFNQTYSQDEFKTKELYQKAIDEFLDKAKKLVDEGEDPNIAPQLVNYPWYYEEYLENLPKRKSEAIDIALKSTFIMLISFLEVKLAEVCKISANHKGINFPSSASNLNGYKIFLENSIGANFNLLDDWSEIYNNYRIIRNKIVHDNSKVSDAIKNLDVSVLNMVHISDNKFYFQSNLICEKLTESMKSLMKKLTKQLNQCLEFPYLVKRIEKIMRTNGLINHVEFIHYKKDVDEDEFLFKIVGEDDFE